MRRITTIGLSLALVLSALFGRPGIVSADPPRIDIPQNTATTFPRPVPPDAQLVGLYTLDTETGASDDSEDLRVPLKAKFEAGKLTIDAKGAFVVKFKYTEAGKTKSPSFPVYVGQTPPPAPAAAPATGTPPPPAAGAAAPGAAPPVVSFGASGDNLDINALRRETGVEANEFKNLVVTLAKTWGTVSGDKNHKDYVYYYDHTPTVTCSNIAKILRDSAAYLQNHDIASTRTAMKARFQQLYASGESEFSRTNPIRKDWEPFLLRLEKDIDAKASSDKYKAKSSDPKFFQAVLLEVADGFDQIADEISNPSAGNTAGPGSGYVGGGAGQSYGGYDDPCCRRRRRCRCSSLLFVR